MDYQYKNKYNKNNYNSKPKAVELPKDFVINGFEKLREELMLKETKDIAKSFCEAKLSSNQLRLFFNEVKALQNKINNEQIKFEQNYPFILMLKSKAEYKYKNDKGTINKVFKDFICESVDYIKEHKDVNTFENFCIVFETIVGYYYGLGGDR